MNAGTCYSSGIVLKSEEKRETIINQKVVWQKNPLKTENTGRSNKIDGHNGY